MNAQNNRYLTTKFAALSDGETIASAKKNYFIWIITVTIIFFFTVAYFSYKLFIAPVITPDQKLQTFNINNTYTIEDQYGISKLKFYNPEPILKDFIKRSRKDLNESIDEESEIQLQTIPEIFVEELLQKNFDNLQDFINLDILLHYESLINKFEIKSLKLIFYEYQSELLEVKKSGDMVNFLRSLKSNKFEFYANLIQQHKCNLELKHFESLFALTEELNHWYNYLPRLSSFLSTYVEQNRKNFENCTRKNFDKYTKETQERLFYFAYPFKITEKKLQEINMIINKWSAPIKREFYNCRMIFYEKALLLSDINKEIQKLNTSCLKYVYVFASHIIYLDSDLQLLGVNLAIVAPEWLFLKKIKINLNGTNGREFTNKTANNNESGMPGNPGGNAGDFIGIGNPYEKFLIISANGGNGGEGQNGAKGMNGAHYTRPGPPVSRPSCASKIKTYSNSFGQMITHYKVFSNFGCGRPGTDGGVGGAGGAGGVITLISDSVRVRKGINGVTGSPGKGGPGGIGGQNGCFYEVLDENDETLHPVTKVKCPFGNTLPSGKHGKDNYNSKGQIFLPEKENLTVHNTLSLFLKFAGEDFKSNNDPKIILFLKKLNQLDLYNKVHARDALTEYKLLEVFDKVELYEIFYKKILKYMEHCQEEPQPVFKYLMSAVLGKIRILKQNVNFYFLDFKSYLDLVEKNNKVTFEQNHEIQSVSYFKKKVQAKVEEIKMNLNQIKIKSTFLTFATSKEEFFKKNNSADSSEELYEREVSQILSTIIDVLFVLMSPADAKQIQSNNLLKVLQGNNSFMTERNSYGNEISFKSPITNIKKIFFNTLENLPVSNSYIIKRNLLNLKNALSSLKESDWPSSDVRNLLETLTVEIEHFVAIYSFLEWEEWNRLFIKSLDNVILNSNPDVKEDEEIKFLKSRLVDDVNILQCKLALNSARLNSYCFKNIPVCINSLQNSSVALGRRSFLQNTACEKADSFSKNHFNAIFDKNSAVGEFYFWPNAKIKEKLKKLFSGEKINLKADIINHHLFDKNLIQFKTLKLEFESGNNSHQDLQDILSHFKIQMIHSGYSYYNWKEETYVFLSDKVNLEYSFRIHENNEPEIYNSLYKKCQDGKIKLSPFTMWTLRLLPIRDAADFSKLLSFIETVNLRLIGTGTYIS